MILERFYSMKNKSVIIEGQKVTQGTVTDFDGNFSQSEARCQVKKTRWYLPTSFFILTSFSASSGVIFP